MSNSDTKQVDILVARQNEMMNNNLACQDAVASIVGTIANALDDNTLAEGISNASKVQDTPQSTPNSDASGIPTSINNIQSTAKTIINSINN